MYIRFFAKDDSPQGRLDISLALERGFRLRLMNSEGQFFREGEKRLHRIINRGLEHEKTLEPAELLTIKQILELIAAEAIQPPDELAAGSTDFHVTEARITEAKAILAALEPPPP